MDQPVWSLAVKRPERRFRRWRLLDSRCIYEVTGPRYALVCFATPVEARSPPMYCLGTAPHEKFKRLRPIYAALSLASSSYVQPRESMDFSVTQQGPFHTCAVKTQNHPCSSLIFLTPAFRFPAQSASLALRDVHKRLLILI